VRTSKSFRYFHGLTLGTGALILLHTLNSLSIQGCSSNQTASEESPTLDTPAETVEAPIASTDITPEEITPTPEPEQSPIDPPPAPKPKKRRHHRPASVVQAEPTPAPAPIAQIEPTPPPPAAAVTEEPTPPPAAEPAAEPVAEATPPPAAAEPAPQLSPTPLWKNNTVMGGAILALMGSLGALYWVKRRRSFES